MSFVAVVLLIVVISICIAIPMAISESRRDKNRIAAAHRHVAASLGNGDYHLNNDNLHRIGINWETRRIMIGSTLDNTYLFDFSQLRDVTIDVNGATVGITRAVFDQSAS